MRFDIVFLASLLPASAMAGVALGPAARAKAKTNPQSASLMSVEGGDRRLPDGTPVSPKGHPNDRAGFPPNGNPDAKNLCGSSGFDAVPIDPKEPVKPTKEDALALAKSVSEGSHSWVIPTTGREIVRLGSVAFFARAEDQRAAIGNADIANLLEDSANNHAQGEYVWVTGTYKQLVNEKSVMACDDDNPYNGIQAVDVEWRIGPPSARFDTDKAPKKKTHKRKTEKTPNH